MPDYSPGVRTMPEEHYFAAVHALSASGAKDILDCPARYRWKRDHRQYKDVFDFGSAAHKLVLGSGPRVEVVNADDWRTKAAQAARDEARAAGKIPVLRGQWFHVKAMADAIRAHDKAAALFDREHGLPEQSLFWHDDEFGIERRARLDWLPDARGGRLIIGDYKTCADASPDAIRKAVGNYAYHIQHAFYCDGATALGLHDDPAFVFVFQEKEPPYLVNVVQLDAAAIQSGRIACQVACEIFRDCSKADLWPGYPEDIPEISLPPWATRIPEDYYQ